MLQIKKKVIYKLRKACYTFTSYVNLYIFTSTIIATVLFLYNIYYSYYCNFANTILMYTSILTITFNAVEKIVTFFFSNILFYFCGNIPLCGATGIIAAFFKAKFVLFKR